MATARDDFDGIDLDRDVWVPHYLPAWSSRAATRATYTVAGSELRLAVPPDAPLWCADTHPEPLRVSGIQSGNRSGPVGSPFGQQRFADDLVVVEAQPTFRGWLPSRGRVAVRARMQVSARSMAALWLSGFEERPEDAGELCVVEVFGHTVRDGSAEVGVGVKALDDPRLRHDFVTPRLHLDVRDHHVYEVAWGRGRSTFSVDGVEVHRSPQAPRYPLQLMVAVFDFPGWSEGDDDHLVPELAVDWIECSHP